MNQYYITTVWNLTLYKFSVKPLFVMLLFLMTCKYNSYYQLNDNWAPLVTAERLTRLYKYSRVNTII